MCFHSKQSKDAQALKKRFNATFKDSTQEPFVCSTHYNGFDYPKTPIITNKESEHIQLFHWGLIPSWANDETIRQHTLNARIETLDDKPSFTHHHTHRCLVLCDGFYEWQWVDPKGKKKQKYEITLPNKELFAFAGIWSEWFDSNGNVRYTYSIVTTEAQRIMRDIHNSKLRMPVVLQPNQEREWLAGDDVKNYLNTGVELVGKTENLQGSLF